MRNNFQRVILSIACAMLIALATTPQARADEWNKATKITFSESVQLPGRVLPAGTYWFKLMDSPSDRHIVQVFDSTNQHLITTVLAIPNYRLQAKSNTFITFDERMSGEPQAIKEWFYPGDLYGQEFVYPKGETLQTAQVATVTPAPQVAEAAPAPATPEETQPTQATPAAPFVDETAPATTPEPTPEPEPQATTPSTDQAKPADTTPETPTNLPKTGSEIPLIAALGGSALGLGAALRSLRRRTR
jgi:LPXTG-motif cell wall-anchored protein